MTTDSKQDAKKRTAMLADLRKQHRDKVKIAQGLLKEQQAARKALKRALAGASKTVPQLAQETGMPAHEVLWHIAAMKKYAQVAEDGLDEDYEYYQYRLVKEAKS